MSDVQIQRLTEKASDEELMAAVAGGDADALGELYDRFSSILKALIIRVVHDDAEADDLLQEIFMQIWRQATHYAPEKGKALGWVVTLTRRRAIDRLRQRQAYCRAKDRMEERVEREPLAAGHNHADENIALSDIRRLLQVRIDSLPAFQKQAIELAYFNGMSQREISAFTGTPLGTVKTRLELGLRKLSDSLNGLREKI